MRRDVASSKFTRDYSALLCSINQTDLSLTLKVYGDWYQSVSKVLEILVVLLLLDPGWGHMILKALVNEMECNVQIVGRRR